IFQDLLPGLPSAPGLHANHASAVCVSPDGTLLAILTTGHNRHYDKTGVLVPELSTEYVFLFDITGATPRQLHVLQMANTFHRIAWGVDSKTLYVSGGMDDLVAEFRRSAGTAAAPFARTRVFILGHHEINGLHSDELLEHPMAGQLAVSPDGARLLVA